MKSETKQSAELTHPGMGTVMSHRAFGERAEECLAAIHREAVHLENTFSRFIADSDISRINRAAGLRAEKISPETVELLAKTLDFCKLGQPYFDVTIGPLVDVWGQGKEKGLIPEEGDIRRALALVDYRDLVLDLGQQTAMLKKAGQSIDLGGIAKGYAADRFLEIYRAYGISSAYSNIGGNVVTLGNKPDGSAWQIGIQHPRQEKGVIGSLGVTGKSVVTSGDYQRYFMDSQGQRRHHILDAHSGYPADAGLISVSVVAENSMTADGLSTLLFAAGMEKGLEILKQFPGSEAIFINKHLQVYVTAGLAGFTPAEGVKVNQPPANLPAVPAGSAPNPKSRILGEELKNTKWRKKMIGWIICIIIVCAIGIGGGIGWSKLAQEHQEAKSLPLNAVDFSKLKDGIYIGDYAGGMYQWRANEVQVSVSGGKVSHIEPIKGVVDQGNGSTQKLYERVIAAQSLQVDTISGATLTAKSYLQAVENALIQAQDK